MYSTEVVYIKFILFRSSLQNIIFYSIILTYISGLFEKKKVLKNFFLQFFPDIISNAETVATASSYL